MSVRVAHEHSGEMEAIHADVTIAERADGWDAADREYVVREERGGHDSLPEMGGSDDGVEIWRGGNVAEKERDMSWRGVNVTRDDEELAGLEGSEWHRRRT